MAGAGLSDGTRTRASRRPSPGGVDDGLPQLPSGEPLLHRWFAVAMIVLIPAGIGVIAWAFLSISEGSVAPAERRPPGDEQVTHDRGDAMLNEIRESEAGPGCAEEVTIVGDASARASLRSALQATCRLLQREEMLTAASGMHVWGESGGVLRVAVFERTGVESSSRVEDGAIVIELNAKFQFELGVRAVPVIVHELVHLAEGWPGAPVDAGGELAAVQAQLLACDRLGFDEDPPRGCLDAAALLGEDDPAEALRQAGYPASEEVER